jgi:hypothetical protein
MIHWKKQNEYLHQHQSEEIPHSNYQHTSPSVVENFRPPLLVGGSSATLKDDGLEAEWVPPLPKGDGAATGEGPTIGWTDEGGLVESWIILRCQLD